MSAMKRLVFVFCATFLSACSSCNDPVAPAQKHDAAFDAGVADTNRNRGTEMDEGISADTNATDAEFVDAEFDMRSDSGREDDMASAFCGDGVIGASEACDDGNTSDGDYCAADCQTITGACGDDVVQANESCDDGNTSDGDYCAADCQTITGACGDGTLQSNEQCDDGMITTGCDVTHDGGDGTCVSAGECADGYVLDGQGDCVAAMSQMHVHILIDNFCNLSTAPTEFRVPSGQTLVLEHHNHANSSYDATIWGSYIGGFTDLPPGQTWSDPYEFCTSTNRPYEEYMDVTVAGFTLNDSTCPGHRLMIYCE